MNGTNSSGARKESSKSSYKLWVLLVVVLLAFWSMFTGSVTLKRSFIGLSDDFKTPNFDDLDILEVEEREKVVRHMWDLYGQSKYAKLPRFWREAFEAAYENLMSDVPGVRDLAFSEIAKLSIFSVAVDSVPVKSQGKGSREDQPRKMGKHMEEKKEAITTKPSSKKEKKKDVKVKPSPNMDDQVESDH